MTTHIKEELGMSPLTVYLSCFINLVQGNMEGMIDTYVGKMLATRTKRFKDESRLTERVFDSKKGIYDFFIFAKI